MRHNHLLRWLLVELRDWLFAIGALFALAYIGLYTGGEWWLAIPVLGAFVALYLAALFVSARLLGEREPDAAQRDGGKAARDS